MERASFKTSSSSSPTSRMAVASSMDMIILGESTGRQMAWIFVQKSRGELDTLVQTLRPLAIHTVAGVSFFVCDHTTEEISSPRAFTARETFPDGRSYQRTVPSSAEMISICFEKAAVGYTYMNQHTARRWAPETTLRRQTAPLSWYRGQATSVYLSSIFQVYRTLWALPYSMIIGIKQASADKGTSSSGVGASWNCVQ